MARRFAIELTEVLDFLQRKIITCQMQQRIKQHGTMSTRKDESVSSSPFGIARVVAQVTRPQCISHRGRSHREPRMTRISFLDSVCSEKAQCVDCTKLKII